MFTLRVKAVKAERVLATIRKLCGHSFKRINSSEESEAMLTATSQQACLSAKNISNYISASTG